MYAIIDTPSRQIIGLTTTIRSDIPDSFTVPIYDQAIYRLLLDEPFKYNEYSIQTTPIFQIILKNRPIDRPTLLAYAHDHTSYDVTLILDSAGTIKLDTQYENCVVTLVAKNTIMLPVCVITTDIPVTFTTTTAAEFTDTYSVYCNYELSVYGITTT